MGRKAKYVVKDTIISTSCLEILQCNINLISSRVFPNKISNEIYFVTEYSRCDSNTVLLCEEHTGLFG